MRILKVAMAITAFCIYGSLFAALNGKGTEAEPYLIASAADFAQIGTDSIYYQLTANFDLPNTREINFNGCLDGAGCTITISASNTLGYGLFNTTQTNSVIKNLNVIISKEIEISSSFSSGGICGENFGTISGCSVDVTGAISSYYSGGICGLNENSGAIFCVAVEKVDGAKIEGKNAGLYVGSGSQPVQKLGRWHVTNIDLGMPLHADCYYVKVRMVTMSPGEFYTIQAIDSNYNSFPFPKNTAFQLDTAFTDSPYFEVSTQGLLTMKPNATTKNYTVPILITIPNQKPLLATYHIVSVVRDPVFTPEGCEYTVETQRVILTSPPPRALIYYALNSAMTDSVRYNGGITVRGTKTLYAVAVLDGISSAVNTATYTQIPSPVSVSGGIASQDSAIVNDSVYITSNEPIPGYRFAYWTSDDVVFDSPNATETFFIMPAKKVSVTANYEAIIYKIKGVNANVSPQQNTVGKITQINASTSEKMFSH